MKLAVKLVVMTGLGVSLYIMNEKEKRERELERIRIANAKEDKKSRRLKLRIQNIKDRQFESDWFWELVTKTKEAHDYLQESHMIPALYVFNAVVIDVHDGDTVNLVIDRGMYDYKGTPSKPVPFRLSGIAARELNMPGGLEAREFIRSILSVNQKVVLTTVKPDKYAPRWRGRLAFAKAGKPDVEYDLSSILVASGWAVPWDGQGAQPIPPWPPIPV